VSLLLGFIVASLDEVEQIQSLSTHTPTVCRKEKDSHCDLLNKNEPAIKNSNVAHISLLTNGLRDCTIILAVRTFIDTNADRIMGISFCIRAIR